MSNMEKKLGNSTVEADSAEEKLELIDDVIDQLKSNFNHVF